jgi:STAS domain-containing protein
VGAELLYRRTRLADPTARRSSRAIEPAGAIGVIARCQHADLSVATGTRTDLVCDAGAARAVDLGTLDTLARLALAARRHRLSLVVEHPPRALVDLLELCGLAVLLARLQSDRAGSVEAGGQAEQRKEALGIEEEHDPGDPIAVDLEHLE